VPSDPERAALTREAVVAAARDLVSEGGLEALSLRRLAARLGVTAPALYAHVHDKRDLLAALAEGQFDELVARMDAAAGLPPVERIRAHCRAYVQHARENPELFGVMFLFSPDLGPAGGTDLPEGAELPAATKAFGYALAAVEEAARDGDLATDDPLLTALALWSATHGLTTVLQLGLGFTGDTEDALLDELLDRLLD
jgi:AcrR family transcriptional regulator